MTWEKKMGKYQEGNENQKSESSLNFVDKIYLFGLFDVLHAFIIQFSSLNFILYQILSNITFGVKLKKN